MADTHTHKIFPMVKIMECIFRINLWWHTKDPNEMGIVAWKRGQIRCGMHCTVCTPYQIILSERTNRRRMKKKLRSKLMSKWQSPWCFHSLCFAFYFEFVVADSFSLPLFPFLSMLRSSLVLFCYNEENVSNVTHFANNPRFQEKMCVWHI